MSDTDTARLIYGNQTFDTSSGKITVFAMRGDQTSRRDYPGEKLAYFRKPWNTSSSLDGYVGHGSWVNMDLVPKNGVVLLIQASTSIQGAMYNSGMQLIALRDTAPLIRVDVRMQPHHNAVFEQVPAFTGRGDVVSYEQAGEYGIVFSRKEMLAYFDEEELNELFTITTLSQGDPKPTMVTVRTPGGGITKVAIGDQPTRRLRIRRQP